MMLRSRFVQVHGTKLWTMLPPPHAVYSRRHASVDAVKVPIEAAARNQSGSVLRCVQHPGDLIYVPDGWCVGATNVWAGTATVTIVGLSVLIDSLPLSQGAWGLKSWGNCGMVSLTLKENIRRFQWGTCGFSDGHLQRNCVCFHVPGQNHSIRNNTRTYTHRITSSTVGSCSRQCDVFSGSVVSQMLLVQKWIYGFHTRKQCLLHQDRPIGMRIGSRFSMDML